MVLDEQKRRKMKRIELKMKVVDKEGEDEEMAGVQGEKEEEVVDDKRATEQDRLIVQLIYL